MIPLPVGRRWLGNASVWSASHLISRVEEYAVDWLLYPYMLYAGGPLIAPVIGLPAADGYWVGFAFMCALTSALNVGYVRLYDRSERDWFGFEAARHWGAHLPSFARLSLRVGGFVYLSVWHSPLFATLWARSRNTVYRMQRSDWMILAGSLLAANVGWTMLLGSAAWFIAALAVWIR